MSLDPSSNCFKSADEARVSHYAVHWVVDFQTHVLRGHCDYTCVPRDGIPPTQVVLDTSGLTIHGVFVLQDSVECTAAYSWDEVVPSHPCEYPPSRSLCNRPEASTTQPT